MQSTPCSPSMTTVSSCTRLLGLLVAFALAGARAGECIVAAGAYHSLAVPDDGVLYAWGWNGNGQLGVNRTKEELPHSDVPMVVPRMQSGVMGMCGGYSHTCVILHGALYCFGRNANGELGNGASPALNVIVADTTAVLGLSDDVRSVSCGLLHTCVIHATERHVRCFGGSQYEVVTEIGLSDADWISLGGYSSCAVHNDTNLSCWGSINGFLPPTLVSQVVGAVSVAIGHGDFGDYIIAIAGNSDLYTWGDNGFGQLGLGPAYASTLRVLLPTKVTELPGMPVQVVSMFGAQCVRTTGGELYCVGDNSAGQLGGMQTGVVNFNEYDEPVVGGPYAALLAGGDSHVCALHSNGSIICWGHGQHGQIGFGATRLNNEPQVVLGIWCRAGGTTTTATTTTAWTTKVTSTSTATTSTTESDATTTTSATTATETSMVTNTSTKVGEATTTTSVNETTVLFPSSTAAPSNAAPTTQAGAVVPSLSSTPPTRWATPHTALSSTDSSTSFIVAGVVAATVCATAAIALVLVCAFKRRRRRRSVYAPRAPSLRRRTSRKRMHDDKGSSRMHSVRHASRSASKKALFASPNSASTPADDAQPPTPESRPTPRANRAAPVQRAEYDNFKHAAGYERIPERLASRHGRGTDDLRSALRESHVVIRSSEVQRSRVLGEGAFGTVYSGKWRNMDVAVKVVKAGHAQAEKDLVSEAVCMTRLRPHANVVQVFGVCTEPLSLVLHFCNGGSLDRALYGRDANKLIDWSDVERLALCQGIAAGVAHLHAEGIVHRDIAARNILLHREGDVYVPKITDFGMSRETEGHSKLNFTINAVGPLKWMAPEQMKGGSYNAASDVFAFGVTLYEVFERSPPWRGRRPMEAAACVLRGENVGIPTSAPARVQSLMKECFLPLHKLRPTMQRAWQVFADEIASSRAGYSAPTRPSLDAAARYGMLPTDVTSSSAIGVYVDPPKPPSDVAVAGYGIPPRPVDTVAAAFAAVGNVDDVDNGYSIPPKPSQKTSLAATTTTGGVYVDAPKAPYGAFPPLS